MWLLLSKIVMGIIGRLILKKVDRSPSLNRHGKIKGGFVKVMNHAKKNRTDVVPKLIFSRANLGVIKYTPVMWTNRQVSQTEFNIEYYRSEIMMNNSYRMRIFARPYWKGNRGWMFNVFSMEIWNLVLVVIVTLSLANVVTQKILTRIGVPDHQDRSYLTHLFHTFASLCNQGKARENIFSKSYICPIFRTNPIFHIDVDEKILERLRLSFLR